MSLDSVTAQFYATCIRVNMRSLHEALEAEDYMRARQLYMYVGEDLIQLGKIVPRLAPGTILPAAEDPKVLAIKEIAAL